MNLPAVLFHNLSLSPFQIVELQQKLKDSQQMHLLGKKQLEEELKEAEEKQTRTQQQFQEEQQKRWSNSLQPGFPFHKVEKTKPGHFKFIFFPYPRAAVEC